MKFKVTTAALTVSALALLAGAGVIHAGPKLYQDGSYIGPPVYQYYGYVQAKVNIQNGKIASIKILRFPRDYYTSYYINTRALPMLEAEVVQAQSTRVYGVSGATLTSEAFLMSTQAALKKARG